jgi:hypothetical protein
MLSYPHWFQESTLPPSPDGTIQWTPMWKYDSDILEIENDSKQPNVYIHHRRERVDLPQRQLFSCYDPTSPPRRVIRGTWFYYYTPSKSFFPFSEEVALRIERWFQSMKEMTSTNGEPIRGEVEMLLPLPHRLNNESIKYKLSAVKEPPTPSSSSSSDAKAKAENALIDGFSVTMRSAAFNDFFSGTIQLERGLRYTPEPEEAWCGTEPDHVVFVVHGIGQSMFAKSETSFKNLTAGLSKLTMEQQETLFNEQQQQAGMTASVTSTTQVASASASSSASSSTSTRSILTQYGNKKRIEYIPIEWYNLVRADGSPLATDLSLVTLPNIQVVRQIANEVVLDILLYLTPEYREMILTHVCARIREIYAIFLELHPTFLSNNGKCSLIGHSLGTVILFDLLSNQRRESIIGLCTFSAHLSHSLPSSRNSIESSISTKCFCCSRFPSWIIPFSPK